MVGTGSEVGKQVCGLHLPPGKAVPSLPWSILAPRERVQYGEEGTNIRVYTRAVTELLSIVLWDPGCLGRWQ